MNKYSKREKWNGKKPIEDPMREYHEDLIYIRYEEEIIECYFESRKLAYGILRNEHFEIKEVQYYGDRPISVEGYLPLGCLRIKSVPRKTVRAVI